MNAQEYRATQADLGEQTEQRAVALYAVYSAAGQPLSREEFAGLLGTVIANANARAAVLADIYQSGRRRRKPQGVGRSTEEPIALAEAIVGVLDDDDPLPRIRRLAKAEPVQASRQAARTVMQANGVRHYRWTLSSKDPCGLCRFLARRKWPVQRVPKSHPGCTCQVVPAIGDSK